MNWLRYQLPFENKTLSIDNLLNNLKRQIGNYKVSNNIRKNQQLSAEELNEQGKFLTVNLCKFI